MKKVLFTICFLWGTLSLWAVKAHRGPITITQSDGTRITVYLHGDEDFHWYTDSAGHILEREGNDFHILDVNPSEFLAKAQSRKLLNQRKRISIGTALPSYFPHTGSPKVLVILVNFQDSVFSVPNPQKTFDQYLNGEGALVDYGLRDDRNHGSVRQFFSDMSEGLFTPQFDVVGPVTVSQPLAYYGKNGSGDNYDVNCAQLVKEACKLVDSQVNFTDYDTDGDGNVDLVYLIYAGYSESWGAPADAIWPKSSVISGLTLDGKNIRRYGVNNELNYYPGKTFQAPPYKRVNGIGLFCHEFSHTLGLPDFYSNLALDNQEMEYWDLMDGGEYTDNGYTPTPYTPWEKEVMDWTKVDSLSIAGTYTLKTDSAVKVNGENGEYLILQNIQNTGWASQLLGHGLLVYRVDYPHTTVNMSDLPNATAGQPAMTILPADSVLISSYRVYDTLADSSDNTPYSDEQYIVSHYGDPFPGTSKVTEIPYVTMNTCTIHKPIYDITENIEEGTITFSYLQKDQTEGIKALFTTTPGTFSSDIYNLTGEKVATHESQLKNLSAGIYIIHGKKVVVK